MAKDLDSPPKNCTSLFLSLLRAYQPLVSLNKALFLGGGGSFGDFGDLGWERNKNGSSPTKALTFFSDLHG